MSLAWFGLLICLIGAALAFTIGVVLVIYYFKQLGTSPSDAEAKQMTDGFKSTKLYHVLKHFTRAAYGMFWGGLIVGLFAFIVGA